jgi:DNA-nicking Smr family endonuclease
MAKRRKPKSKRITGKHGMLEDDAALWQAFVQNIDPLGLKGRVPDKDSFLFEAALRQELCTTEPRAKSSPTTKSKNVKPARAPAEPKTAPQPRIIEPRQVRRLGNGRTSVDARIDLHGMRQSEAYVALKVFLFRSVAKGHRMVLVITGKGSASFAADGEERFGAFINEGAVERGVLRRNVPLWLAQPEFRSIIVGHTTAHVRHGGEGALYVQLRRAR